MKIRALLLLTLSFGAAFAQSPVYIAPFPHDANGAYTLIHDDYGATYARGIENYIDTMNQRRKLPICFAAITGECNQDDWDRANEMIAHGHQLLNHSMSHYCGQPVDWCPTQTWDEHDFSREIDASTELIVRHTGKHPAFFVFPFDLFTDTMLTYLQAKGYMGARSGTQNALNPPSLEDPFAMHFTVYRPGQPTTVLNELADEAVQKKSWAVRVMHGIEDESWGHLSEEDYAAHLDHLQQLVLAHKLWMATLSDVISYQYLNKSYAIAGTQKNEKGQVTAFSMEAAKVILPQQPLTLHTLTVVIEQAQLPKSILQNGKNVSFVLREHKIIAELEAQPGNVVLTY